MQNDGSISPLKAFLKNKWVRAVLIVDVVILLVVIVIIIFNATKTAVISLNVTPVDSVIQLDGHGSYQNATYRIHPGTHTVTISHTGFDSKTISVDIPSGYNTSVNAFLSNGGQFDFYEMNSNYISYIKLAEIASAANNITIDQDTSAEDFIAAHQKALSLIQTELPIDYYEYVEEGESSPKYKTTKGITISAENDSTKCRKTLCLRVNLFKAENQDFAKNLLIEKGFDLNLIEVLYETRYPE